MLITKKESKDLRYFARANYKSAVKGVDTEKGKIKHREFPCFGLSYDEAKADKGMVELTNVTIGGKPFDGEYTALMTRLRVLLDSPDDICAEELEQDKTLTEQVVDAVKEKSDTIVIAEKRGDVLKETIKDVLPEGSQVAVDVKPKDNRIDVDVQVAKTVDHIDVRIEATPVEEAPAQELPVSEDVEESGKVAKETGAPVITAEQKRQKSRWELFDLHIKCATMALAKSYGEPPESDICTIMSRYPDAMDKLNALYAKDGIQPYTISEDAIKTAYPDEYAALCS